MRIDGKKLSIGYSNSKRLIEDNMYFIDSSLFIKDKENNSSYMNLCP